MPELSRFFGIIIRMYMEVGGPHQVIGGELPLRQRRLVEAWVELHREELIEDWARLQRGQRPRPIEPLR